MIFLRFLVASNLLKWSLCFIPPYGNFRLVQNMKNMVRMSKPKVLSVEEADASIQPLMNLASAHFASQALNAIITLGIPDIIGNATMTIGDIASNIEGSTNEDALLRTMRLVSTVGILIEESSTSLDGTKEF